VTGVQTCALPISVVIVGAGHAGFQLATSLRQAGFADPIHLINDEAHLPYQRPPLSKAYLKGTGGPETLMFRPQKFYADQTIDLVHDRVVSVQRDQRKVLLASGKALGYGHLVFATEIGRASCRERVGVGDGAVS